MKQSFQEIEAFLRSIYLGDRACKGYSLDSWANEFRIFVSEISRVPPWSETWKYYQDENIQNGRICFSGVSSLKFDTATAIPNDYIEIVGVSQKGTNSGQFLFKVEIGCADDNAIMTELNIEITATGMHLESPERPGAAIVWNR